MNPDDPQRLRTEADERFRREIAAKQARQDAARRHPSHLSWIGLYGLVGWSVAIPTLLGVALGAWLDEDRTGTLSWTITLLFVGLLLGCGIAWYWIRRESRER